jgi:hypothetical protein
MIQRNIINNILDSIQMPVMFVMRPSVRSLKLRDPWLYIVASIRMYVKKHSVRSVIWRDTSVHILASVRMPVMCVKKRSVKSLIWTHTGVHILASVRMSVMCVKKRSVRSLIWKHTGQRPYVCDVCKKTFSQKYHVMRHQLIHSGQLP